MVRASSSDTVGWCDSLCVSYLRLNIGNLALSHSYNIWNIWLTKSQCGYTHTERAITQSSHRFLNYILNPKCYTYSLNCHDLIISLRYDLAEFEPVTLHIRVGGSIKSANERVVCSGYQRLPGMNLGRLKGQTGLDKNSWYWGGQTLWVPAKLWFRSLRPPLEGRWPG